MKRVSVTMCSRETEAGRPGKLAVVSCPMASLRARPSPGSELVTQEVFGERPGLRRFLQRLVASTVSRLSPRLASNSLCGASFRCLAGSWCERSCPSDGEPGSSNRPVGSDPKGRAARRWRGPGCGAGLGAGCHSEAGCCEVCGDRPRGDRDSLSVGGHEHFRF